MRRPPTLLILLLVVAVGLTLLHLLVGPLGYLAVKRACERAGGMTINVRPTFDSYVHAGYQWAEGVETTKCDLCAEQVARGQFSRVAFLKKGTREDSGIGVIEYRLEANGHKFCVSGASFSRPPPGKCVAIEPHTTVPQERYEYRSVLKTTNEWLGVPIVVRERTLIDLSSKQVIAVQRYFSYATPIERAGRFEPGYHCDRSELDPRVEGTFFTTLFEGANQEPAKR